MFLWIYWISITFEDTTKQSAWCRISIISVMFLLWCTYFSPDPSADLDQTATPDSSPWDTNRPDHCRWTVVLLLKKSTKIYISQCYEIIKFHQNWWFFGLILQTGNKKHRWIKHWHHWVSSLFILRVRFLITPAVSFHRTIWRCLVGTVYSETDINIDWGPGKFSLTFITPLN